MMTDDRYQMNTLASCRVNVLVSSVSVSIIASVVCIVHTHNHIITLIYVNLIKFIS
jgi:hypothetical protein